MQTHAAICRAHGTPLEMGDIVLAAPGDTEVVVRIAAVAICHSDIIFADGGWGGTLPAVYGHEAAGRVEQVGAGVTGLAPGDTVVVTMVRACGTCPCCTRGRHGSCETRFPIAASVPIRLPDGTPVSHGMGTAAFAGHVLVDRAQVVKFDPSVPMDQAALLACGVITGWGAVTSTARMEPGSDVAVIGAGGVGLNAVQTAALKGARHVIVSDTSPAKRQLAAAFGATEAVDAADAPAEIRRITGGRGVDYVFVTVGSTPAMKAGLQMLAPGGALVLAGMPAYGTELSFEPVDFASGSCRILGSKMASDIRRDIPEILRHAAAGRFRLAELVSAHFEFARINDAIAAARSGQGIRNVVMLEAA